MKSIDTKELIEFLNIAKKKSCCGLSEAKNESEKPDNAADHLITIQKSAYWMGYQDLCNIIMKQIMFGMFYVKNN